MRVWSSNPLAFNCGAALYSLQRATEAQATLRRLQRYAAAALAVTTAEREMELEMWLKVQQGSASGSAST